MNTTDNRLPDRILPDWPKYLLGFATLGVASFVLVFLWPSLYRYDTYHGGQFTYPVRINRITGQAERLLTTGWVPMEPAVSQKTPATPLDWLQLVNITGRVGVDRTGYFTGELYNGNDFPVENIVIHVTVKNANGGMVLDRDYRLTGLVVKSKSSSSVLENAGFALAEGQRYSWNLVSAERR